MAPPNWNDSADNLNLNEVLFEYISVGNAVRVSAIDPITNTEVVVVGSGYMSHYTLKMNALRKLKHVLSKKQAAGNTQPSQPQAGTRSLPRTGHTGDNSFRAKIPFKR